MYANASSILSKKTNISRKKAKKKKKKGKGGGGKGKSKRHPPQAIQPRLALAILL